jgi:hypothetical protein
MSTFDNPNLSESQRDFAIWLQTNTPYLLCLFDFEKRWLLEDKVENFLAVASHGEALMARFALGIWLNRDEYDFKFIQAAQTLDAKNRSIIADWLNDPFWP